MSDDGFYTMSDGREDVTWMRPYREAVQALPLPQSDRDAVERMLDEVYLHAVEERTEEQETQRKLLAMIFGPKLDEMLADPEGEQR